MGPFTAIAGGLSPVLLLLSKAVCGRRTFAFGRTFAFALASPTAESGRERSWMDAVVAAAAMGGAFARLSRRRRCRFFLLPLSRSPAPSFHAWH